jgi:small subunit ribosomal protein S16
MLSIRMTRVGSKKKPFFRVVVSEARSGLLGDVIENVGTYNPRSKPAKVDINTERIQHWLNNGARPSDSVRTLLKKHLTRDLSVPTEPTGYGVRASEAHASAQARTAGPEA